MFTNLKSVLRSYEEKKDELLERRKSKSVVRKGKEKECKRERKLKVAVTIAITSLLLR